MKKIVILFLLISGVGLIETLGQRDSPIMPYRNEGYPKSEVESFALGNNTKSSIWRKELLSHLNSQTGINLTEGNISWVFVNTREEQISTQNFQNSGWDEKKQSIDFFLDSRNFSGAAGVFYNPTNGQRVVLYKTICMNLLRVQAARITQFDPPQQQIVTAPINPGYQVVQGPAGPQGPQGLPGLPGRDGISRDTSITIIKKAPLWPSIATGVGSGALTAFLLSKPGPAGKDGTNGTNGTNGLPGKDGQPGKDGLPGKDGQPGKDGLPGKDGQPGKDGTPADAPATPPTGGGSGGPVEPPANGGNGSSGNTGGPVDAGGSNNGSSGSANSNGGSTVREYPIYGGGRLSAETVKSDVSEKKNENSKKTETKKIKPKFHLPIIPMAKITLPFNSNGFGKIKFGLSFLH